MFVLAMSTWVSYLIAGGIVLGVGGLFYLLFRFGQNSMLKGIMQHSGTVLNAASIMFKDKEGKVDTHDILKIVGGLATTAAGLIKNPRKTKFEHAKEDMVGFINTALKELDVKAVEVIDPALIEKMAEAAFTAYGATEKIKNTIKKSEPADGNS